MSKNTRKLESKGSFEVQKQQKTSRKLTKNGQKTAQNGRQTQDANTRHLRLSRQVKFQATATSSGIQNNQNKQTKSSRKSKISTKIGQNSARQTRKNTQNAAQDHPRWRRKRRLTWDQAPPRGQSIDHTTRAGGERASPSSSSAPGPAPPVLPGCYRLCVLCYVPRCASCFALNLHHKGCHRSLTAACSLSALLASSVLFPVRLQTLQAATRPVIDSCSHCARSVTSLSRVVS